MGYEHDKSIILRSVAVDQISSMFTASSKATVFIMPGGFIRREPTDSSKLRENREVVELFTWVQWISFCDKLQGYDDEVAEEFLQALRPKSKTLATVNFRGLSLTLTPQYIS